MSNKIHAETAPSYYEPTYSIVMGEGNFTLWLCDGNSNHEIGVYRSLAAAQTAAVMDELGRSLFED